MMPNNHDGIMNRSSRHQRAFLTKGEKIRYRSLLILFNTILYGVAISYIFPFLFLLANSFKDRKMYQANVYNFPANPVMENYQNIFGSNDFYIALGNTLFNTIVTIFLVIIFSFMIAYFTSRYEFKGKKFFYYFFLIGMLIPVHSLLIPTYILYRKIGIINQWYTLIIPYVTFGIPQALFLFDSYLKAIPKSLEEAAVLDGATTPCIMSKIIFPLAVPMAFTIMILNFMSTWNEFSFALVLNNVKAYKTIPLWLQNFQGQYTSNTPLKLTALLVSCIPIILLFIFFREKMMSGIAAGAVKE
ncbi:MAG: carbohydrate ABC transporter permease [Christensenellaceae bacterium]